MYLYDFLPMLATLAIGLAWYDANIKPSRKSDVELGVHR
jgi:hypothetical protein